MKNSRLARLAATGAAAALATAGLVAGTGTPASAVTGSATYVCPTGLPLPGLDRLEIPMDLSTDTFDGPLPARADLAGAAPVSALATVPADLVGALLGLLQVQELGAEIPGFTMLLGDVPVQVSNLSAPLTALAPGDLPLSATGVIGSLTTPAAAGVYDLEMPAEFELVPLAAPLPPLLGALSCALPAGADPVIGQVEVVKAGSTISGRAKETRKGHAVVARVSRDVGGDVFGRVVARLGKRTLASKAVNRRGKATLALPRKVHGKRVTLVYRGDPGTRGSRTSVRMP